MSPIFKHLTEEDLALINSDRYEMTYKPGELIFKERSPITHLISFTKGLGMLFIDSRTRKLIVKFILPGDFVGAVGLFNDDTHRLNLKAVEASTLCLISRDNFLEVLDRNKAFNHAFLTHIVNYNNIILKKLMSFHQLNATGRIASSILHLSNDIYKDNPFQISFPIIELANFSGMSKESAFRIIRDLTDDGVLTINKKKINILQKSALEELARKG